MAGEIPGLSRAELEALQLDRLRDTLRAAYDKVPHYRHAFDQAGAHPDDLTTLADIARFPFTTKADLRENYPFGMFAVPREEVARIHSSSGATGKPTVVGYTRADLDTWAELMARSIRAAGGRPGDVSTSPTATGCSRSSRRRWDRAARLHGGAGQRRHDRASGAADPRLRAADHHGDPVVLPGDPRRAEGAGVDARQTSLQIGIFGAEPWTDEMRRNVEEHSGIRAVDIYGLSEVMGPGVSQEAGETQDGLHVWEDHFLPEIVDPVTLEVLPDGEDG